MEKSFWSYVEQTFGDLIDKSIDEYAKAHMERLTERCRIHRIDDIELYDTNIKSVRVEDDKEWRIKFDIIVEATFLVHGHHRSDGEDDEVSEWFLLCCGGDLAKDLRDAWVISIEEYSNKRSFVLPMTDKLLPFITPADYEGFATNILRKYYPEALSNPIRLNPEVLATRIGLKVLYRTISEDNSVFGQIFFEDCDTELYDRARKQYYTEHISAKTVLIDKDTAFLYSFGTMNATVVHECVHYLLHLKAFLFAKLFDKSLSQFQCKVIGGQTKTVIDAKMTDEMEYQANTLAPKILMPAAAFKRKAEKLIAVHKQEEQKTETIDVLEPVIEDLARFYGVSKLSAKIRLIETGYEDAAGTFIYLDGHYVKPHKYRKGAIEKNQTFSIGVQDALIQTLSDTDLFERVSRGEYLYIDSHFVLNSEKYVESDEGSARLTDYARYHMDECCLPFEISVKKQYAGNARYNTICILNREYKSPFEYDIKFTKKYENASPEERSALMRKEIIEEESLYEKMTNNYVECLRIARKERKMTYEEIAELIDKDVKTVQRIFTGETNSTLETLVAVCLALHLPPKVSRHIISHSSVTFKRGDEAHTILQFALGTLYKSPMSEIKSQLEIMGVQL